MSKYTRYAAMFYKTALGHKRATMATVLILFIVVSFAFLNRPANNSKSVINFEVQQGSSAHDIATLLADKGLIRSRAVFDLFAKIEGLDNKLQSGTYALSPSMSTQAIVQSLASGRTIAHGITIPEGYTVKQIAALLAEKGIISNEKTFLDLASRYALYPYMQGHDNVKYACEGFLFPDTYDFAPDSKPEQILQRLTAEFDRQFTAAMREQAKKDGLSVYEAVTLASLVEREARLKEERPEVASVFLNRLKIKMPLQSCATVQYVLPEHKEVLSIADTRIDSPYNTYVNSGLPPGPIANPGIACLKAALEPAHTDYLFFVVNGKGGHYFAKTYAEHEANMNK